MECSKCNHETRKDAEFREAYEENFLFPKNLALTSDGLCPECGALFHPNSQFCQECGLELAQGNIEKEMVLQKTQNADPGYTTTDSVGESINASAMAAALQTAMEWEEREAGSSAGLTEFSEDRPNRKSVIEQAFTELSDALAKSSLDRQASVEPIGNSESAAGEEASGVSEPVKEPGGNVVLNLAEGKTVEPAGIVAGASISAQKAEVLSGAFAFATGKQNATQVSPATEGKDGNGDEKKKHKPAGSMPPHLNGSDGQQHTSITKASLALLVGVAIMGACILFFQKPSDVPRPKLFPNKDITANKAPETAPEKAKEGENFPAVPADSGPVAIDSTKIPGEENAGDGVKQAGSQVSPPVASAAANGDEKKGKGIEGKGASSPRKLVVKPIEQPPKDVLPTFDYSLAPQYGTADDRRRAGEQLERIRALRLQQQSQLEKNQ